MRQVRVRDAWIVAATLAFLNPDIRGAVPAGVTHLMGARWTCWLLAKVNIEVLIDHRSQYHSQSATGRSRS